MDKAARDNRSRQLNPQDPTFHESRGTLPGDVTPGGPPPPTQQSAEQGEVSQKK